MNRRTPAALLALATFALLLPSQDEVRHPTPQPTQPGVRLTYELPVDTLQRQLQRTPDQDLEQVLAGIVRTMQARLGALGTVTRHQATGFTIDIEEATPEVLARVERRVAIAGRLEMWIVADGRYREADLALEQEQKHLLAWLADGNRERVQKDPRAVADMPRRERSQVRWVPRVIRPHQAAGQPGRWHHPLSKMGGDPFRYVVPVFDEGQWNGGAVPVAMQNADDPFLVELVPLNLHAASFSDRDLDGDKIAIGAGRNGRPAIRYTLLADRRRAYADWSGRFTGSASGVVLDGVLVTAPVFLSKIPGAGILEGDYSRRQAEDLVSVLKSRGLPAAPQLVAKEALRD